MWSCLRLLIATRVVAQAAVPSASATTSSQRQGESDPGSLLDFDVTARPHPPPFRIVDKFTANFSLRSDKQHGLAPIFDWTNGTFIYDTSAGVAVQISDLVFGPLHNYPMRFTRIHHEDTLNEIWTTGCVNFSVPDSFSQVFEKFAVAGNYSGKMVVRGRPCDLYVISNGPSSQSLCVSDGRWPVRLDNGMEEIVFESYVTTVDPSRFIVPDVCKRIPAPCGDGAAVTQTVYVSHPRNDYNISGQDVANAKGDVVFLCFDTHMARSGDYELLSAFDITIIRNFTQDANFPPPGERGFGGDLFHVGRETPFGIGKHWGRCTDDEYWREQLGEWLSLPRAGQCVRGSQTLGRDCMWRIERRLATIELSCLLKERGLQQHCNRTVAPFSDATEMLLKAMWSEDVAHGACPRVKEAECALHPRCAHLHGDCCPHEDGTMLDCCSSRSSNATFVMPANTINI